MWVLLFDSKFWDFHVWLSKSYCNWVFWLSLIGVFNVLKEILFIGSNSNLYCTDTDTGRPIRFADIAKLQKLEYGYGTDAAIKII